MRLLILDDEVWTRRGILSIIESAKLDFEAIQESGDGIEALEMIREFRPDILLVDIRMPGIDGLSFIQRASETLDDAKYIIISGYDEFAYAKKAILLQVSDYILKPIEADNLLQSLRNAMGTLENERKKALDLGKSPFLMDGSIPQIREKIIGDIVSGAYTGYPPAFVEKLFGMELRAGCFAWVMTKLAREDRLGSKLETLKKALAARIEEGYMGAVSVDGHGLVCALLMDSDAEHLRTKQRKFQLRDDIQRLCADLGCPPLQVALSDECCGLEGAKNSYWDTISAIQRKTVSMPTDCLSVQAMSAQARGDGMSWSRAEKGVEESVLIASDPAIQGALRRMLDLALVQEQPIGAVERMIHAVDRVGMKVISDYDVDSCAIRCLTEQEKTILYYDDLEDLLSCLEGHLAAVCAARASSSGTKKAIQDVKNYIQTHYDEDISLLYLAKMTHLNQTYLSELFKESTGMNFKDYLTRIRLDKACELLGQQNMPINQVALLVGYEDTRYFSTVFKKGLRLTPKEYRNKLRADRPDRIDP